MTTQRGLLAHRASLALPALLGPLGCLQGRFRSSFSPCLGCWEPLACPDLLGSRANVVTQGRRARRGLKVNKACLA